MDEKQEPDAFANDVVGVATLDGDVAVQDVNQAHGVGLNSLSGVTAYGLNDDEHLLVTEYHH